MQSLRFIPLILSSAAVLLATTAHADTRPADKAAMKTSGWHTSFSQAEAEAKASGKPLIVHFYADWCGPCQQMEKTVLNQPEVLRCLGEHVVGVKVNADHHPELKSRFGVSGFPSDVMVSPSGEVSTRYVGMTSESSFIARLKREGAKFAGEEETELAKTSEKKEQSATKAAPTDSKHLGLNGYSPVALTTGKLWKKGKSEFSALYRGIVYRFTDEEELELFLEKPAAYAPRLLGCDPVLLAESGRAVQGKIELGVFYRESVYLMATEANREEFLRNPDFYASKHFAVEVDEIEQYVSR